MTISTLTSKVSYTGNGVTTVFAYTYKIFADSELKVYDNGVLKTLTTHYTVSGAGGASGGNVTFTAGNIPANLSPVVIARNISKTQATDYVENDSFPAETHESALDKLTMLVQDVDNSVTADIFRFSETVGDAGVVTITKTVAERGNKLLAFDAAGDLQATQEIGILKGNWAATTAYVVRDLIKDTSNNNIYICITAHTSSGSQPISSNTDVAKWTLIVDAASATTSASSATSSASSASTSASTATTQAGIATAQAVISTAKAVLTASDAVDTAADLVLTNADVVLTNADVVLAEAAQVSAVGAVGATAWKYTFSTTTTMSDPTTGVIRLDHGTLASVTNIAIDATSADTGNPDVSDLIASIDDGTNSTHEGYIFIRKHGTPATFMAYNVTGAIVDNTGWLQIPVSHAASGGTLSDTDSLYISFTRSGNAGVAATLNIGSTSVSTVGAGGSATASSTNSGSTSAATFNFAFGIPTGATGATGTTGTTGTGSSGFSYQFETTTTDADQGAGKIWLNHGTVASATILYIDDDDSDGTDISAFTATWDDSSATSDKGFIKIQSKATPTDYAVFKISASGTDGTAYWKFPVTHLVSAGTFSDTEAIDVFFTRSGDSGGVANRTVDTMTGDGSEDELTLSQDPSNENNVTITLDGVTQHHDTFSLSGTTVTFSTAPALGVKVEAVSGGQENIGTPSDNTVTSVKIVDGAILNADVNASAAIATSKLSGAVTSIPSHGLGALASLATVGNGQIDNNSVDEDKLKDALIADFTEVTVASGDSLLLGDATDSGNTKRDTVQGILDLVTVAGLDATPTPDHTINGPQTNTLLAGYTTAIGDLVYLDPNGRWEEADADATGTSISLLGIAMEVKSDGAAVNVALSGSFIVDASWSFGVGVPLYVHTTAGAITATKPTGSGDVVRTVGYALTATTIFFAPSSDYVTLA